MSTEQVEIHEVKIEVPDKVKVSEKHKILSVEGPLGKTRKNFKKIAIDLKVEGKNVLI